MTVQLLKYAQFDLEFEVNSIALRQDASQLACGGFVEDSLAVHGLPQAEPRQQMSIAYAGAPNDSVCWSRSDRLAAVADGATRVWIWDAQSGARLHDIDCGAIGRPESISFNATGSLLAISGSNLFARSKPDLMLVDLEDGSLRTFDTGIDARRVAWIGDALVAAGVARTEDGPLALSVLAPGAEAMLPTTYGAGSDRDAFICATPVAGEAVVMSWDNDEMCTQLRFVNVLEAAELLQSRFSDAECKGMAYLAAAGRVVALFDDGGEAAIQLLDPLSGLAEGFPAPGRYINGGLAVSDSGAFAVANERRVTVFKLASA